MNRYEFWDTLDEVARKQFLKDAKDIGYTQTARKHQISYQQAKGIALDHGIKINKQELRQRQTHSLSKHFANQRLKS